MESVRHESIGIMDKEFRILLMEMGKTARRRKEPAPDFEHISKVFRHYHVNLSMRSLRRLWATLHEGHALSLSVRNRLALFAGFQSWDDLQDALHGDTDAGVNYGDRQQ